MRRPPAAVRAQSFVEYSLLYTAMLVPIIINVIILLILAPLLLVMISQISYVEALASIFILTVAVKTIISVRDGFVKLRAVGTDVTPAAE